MKRQHYRSICFKSILQIALVCVLIACAATPSLTLPGTTRVLGVAISYRSLDGKRLEVVHDDTTRVAIVKLSDGTMTILPLENIGIEGRYRDNHMTLWEHDNAVLLWINGEVVFAGTIE